MTASAASLARLLAAERDDTILEAVSLLISLRPGLQQLLLGVLQEPPATRFTGTIKNFSEKYGFIDCKQTKKLYGMDVFVSDMEKGVLNVGDAVSFTVVLNKSGKPQARLLEMEDPVAVALAELTADPEPAEPEPVEPVTDDATSARQWLQQAIAKRAAGTATAEADVFGQAAKRPLSGGEQVQPASKAARTPAVGWGTGERLMGVIKHFSPAKRYGFIACEETMQRYGVDVFLSDMEIGEFSQGSMVSFVVTFNKDGKPQARQLKAAVEEDAPSGGELRPPHRHLHRQIPGVTSGNVGFIRDFWPEKHYGFIVCDAVSAMHGADVFLAEQELNGFGVGSWVQFDIALNKNGKPQARNVRQPQM